MPSDYALRLIIARLWDRVVGPEVASATLVNNFSDGTLTVMVPNAAWVEQLTPRTAELCEALNHALLEPELVRDIQFAHGVPYVVPV